MTTIVTPISAMTAAGSTALGNDTGSANTMTKNLMADLTPLGGPST